MEFGTVTHAVGHHMSFEETLATIKGIGFNSILLLTSRDGQPVGSDGACKDPFPNVLRSDPGCVLRAVGNAGLEIAALHFSGKLDIQSDAGIDPTITALRDYAACALELGCPNLTHPVPSCGRTGVPTDEKSAEITRLARCMNTVAEEFGPKGLHIAVDIHHKAWVEGVDDCRLLLASMPSRNSGILLNIGHMTTAQGYGWLLVDEHPGRIPAVGWKDHSLDPNRPRPMWSIELGKAHSPFGLYIKAFKRNPEDRAHFINCENVPDEQRVGALKRSRDYLMTLWDETN